MAPALLRAHEVFCDLLVQTAVEGKRFEKALRQAQEEGDAEECSN